MSQPHLESVAVGSTVQERLPLQILGRRSARQHAELGRAERLAEGHRLQQKSLLRSQAAKTGLDELDQTL